MGGYVPAVIMGLCRFGSTVELQHVEIIAKVVQAVPSVLIGMRKGVASLKAFDGVAAACTMLYVLSVAGNLAGFAALRSGADIHCV